jgi:DNA-binding response OmpR family regulator
MSRLLIVEDKQDVADMLAVFLRREGHEVSTVEDGAGALTLLRTDAFDLIILDLMMPHMNGYDLAERIREKDKQTPMLLITGADGVLIEAHAHKAGINEIMHKPLDPPALALKVEEMVGVTNRPKGDG